MKKEHWEYIGEHFGGIRKLGRRHFTLLDEAVEINALQVKHNTLVYHSVSFDFEECEMVLFQYENPHELLNFIKNSEILFI